MCPNDTTSTIPDGYCQCGCGQHTRISQENDSSKGWVKGQPLRFVLGHSGRVGPRRPLEECFWEKVDKRGPDDCWLWTGAKTRSGYGQMTIAQKRQTASRVSWEIHHGPIPDGLWLLHRCDNPRCVNPNHLFLGTHTDNMRDMISKGRRDGTKNRPRGESQRLAKVTDHQVQEMRIRATNGEKLIHLALEYGITVSAVSSIVNRKTWKHIA